METYSGYINGLAFAQHLLDFTKKLDASVIRTNRGEKEDEQRRGG